MPAFQQITLMGNLGRDPESRTFPSGDQVCNFSIAVTDKWKNAQGEPMEHTEWFNITCPGGRDGRPGLAGVAGQYLRKGSAVFIVGTMRTRKYVDKDGNERTSLDIRADTMKLLGDPSGGGQQGGGQGGYGGDQRGGYDNRGQQGYQQGHQGGGQQGNQRGYSDNRGAPPQQGNYSQGRSQGGYDVQRAAGGGGYDQRGQGGGQDARGAPPAQRQAPPPQQQRSAPPAAATTTGPGPGGESGFDDLSDDIPF